MSMPFSGKLILSTAALFALSAIPAFANHGGGGGGSHGGGGGFHGGGGSHGSSGGGHSYSAPAAGYGSRASAPSRSYSRAGYASRPSSNEARPSGNMSASGQRYGNASSASPAVADGQWHSFGNGAANRGASGQPAGNATANNGGVHVLSGNRAAPGTVRSFSGQGGEIWENSSASRNVVSRSQSLSTIHNSFSSGAAAGSVLRPSAGFSASTRFASGSSLVARNGFVGGVNTAGSIPQLRGSLGFGAFGGRPFGTAFGRSFVGPFGGFGRCWGCGFGFGFGWGLGGWGWPGLGFGLWDPFWFDSWWGYTPPPYGYYGYPPAYPDSGYYTPDDNYNGAPPDDNGPQAYNQSYDFNGNWVTPNGPSPAQVPNAQAFSVPILIYMKNGSLLSVRDYWMVDGELHYVTMSGTEKTADLEAVDLPRTNTENAKSGVKFIFKSEPSVVAPGPQQNGAPPSAQPNTAPSPTQQINVPPQSESRT
jgi:hypothetical protein